MPNPSEEFHPVSNNVDEDPPYADAAPGPSQNKADTCKDGYEYVMRPLGHEDVLYRSELITYQDPVKKKKKSDKLEDKPKPSSSPKKDEDKEKIRIKPSMNTRIDFRVHCQPLPQTQFGPEQFKPAPIKPKYVVPSTESQEQFFEKHRAHTAKKYHCNQKHERQTAKLPIPLGSKKLSREFTAPSPEASSAKVVPRRVTPTGSWLHPDAQTSEELNLKKPKSGIFINVEGGKKDEFPVYDSFDLVYKRKPRPDRKRKQKKVKEGSLEDILEEEEGKHSTKKRGKLGKKTRSRRRKPKSTEKFPEEQFIEMLENDMQNQDPEGAGDYEEYLTKQFRRKVSQISHGTSYQSQDFREEGEEPPTIPAAFQKYVQKFRRDSEVKKYEPKKRKIKRGTLESHSFTNVNQPILKQFYFGSKPGTMHYGDKHIPEEARYMQGICIPVAAYCYSFLKHPNRWTAEEVDEILDVGSRLYLSSLSSMHAHRPIKELKPEDLEKYCYIGEKKVHVLVDEPEVAGVIKSTDKTVYNVTKALKIFFDRQKGGILQTQDTNIAIWRDKYYYFFEGKARTKDLYYNPENGTAIMAHFYDVPSIVTVLLQRSSMQNWPFVIYPIKVYKVMNKDEEDDEKDNAMESRSNYNILNENKAILLGSYDLGDKCFGFTRNKQSLPMAIVCLVYSRITPPSAWHKSTIDKIMIVGNQLYIECMQCDQIDELGLSNMPAFFTVGPYMVEIFIYANRKVDMMYSKCCCQLNCAFEEFFKSNTNGILQLEKKHLAIWKQRNMFYCFDPYPRGTEGFCSRDGYSCVSMHANIESVVNVISNNFDDKDQVFHIHSMKVCKILRDPVQSEKFPKHIPLDEFPPEHFKTYKMMKSKKAATEKPVTVDYTALAMKSLIVGETPDPSIFEIGSTVESLAQEQIPPMLCGDRIHSRLEKLQKKTPLTDQIADLDSPSLSDTQIEPDYFEKPTDPLIEELPFMDLNSFELTQEEIEMEEIVGGEGFEGGDELHFRMRQQEEEDFEEEMENQYYDMGEGEELDFGMGYYAGDKSNQVREGSLIPLTMSEQINTDLSYFPIHKDILYPPDVRERRKREFIHRVHEPRKCEWLKDGFNVYMPVPPDVTKSEELRKETNFIDLPDDSQIIRGTKNVSAYGKDQEFMSPYVCIMADVVSKKYSILSWSPEIVDYVLKCGSQLKEVSKYRYDQVSKLEIPNISLGKTKFAALVEYVFDSYARQNILDMAIEKILFVRSDMGVLVTPTYSCGLIKKNHLYYMYDGFGNNEVGLNTGTEEGVACFSRFKDVHSLTTRIMYNKRTRELDDDVSFTRFVMSSVRVQRIYPSAEEEKKKLKDRKQEPLVDGGEDSPGGGMDLEEDEEPGETREEEPKPEKKHLHKKRKMGYNFRNGLWVIEGTRGLSKSEPSTTQLPETHFTCLCASLMLVTLPVHLWDRQKVDEVLDYGNYVYTNADDLAVSEKRTIKNMFIGKHFFDIVVKQIHISKWEDNVNLKVGITTLMGRKYNHFLVQFEDACLVFYHTPADGKFHIFFPLELPYGKKKKEDGDTTSDAEEGEDGDTMAGWLRLDTFSAAQHSLRRVVSKRVHYDFYTFEVTSIRKVPKDMLINYKLNQYDKKKVKKPEKIGSPFHEDPGWLIEPVPWARKNAKTADGKDRDSPATLQGSWHIELPNDLYSLVGNIPQTSDRFPEESRGKQTLCNIVCCIAMTDIYEFPEWNQAVVDSILVNGDQYYHECMDEIMDSNYEISMEDLKENVTVFPFTATVDWKPIVEGTMYLLRPTQFNVYKALRLFFDNHNRRMGILHIQRTKSDKKQVAIGKTKPKEYFMFDCDPRCADMFVKGDEKAYVLRCTSLNRLLHVLVLTLVGGDFYLYEVNVKHMKPIS